MVIEVVLPLPLFKTFDYLVPSTVSPSELESLIGKRVRVPFGYTHAIGVVWRIKNSSEFPRSKLKPFGQILDEEPVLNADSRCLAEWISVHTACSLGDAVSAMLPLSFANQQKVLPEPSLAPLRYRSLQDFSPLLKTLHSAVYDGKSAVFFIQSNSLNERMAVYFSLVADVLAQNKTVLIMVPEIRLGRQLFHAFHEKLGDAVCFWDSEQSQKEQEALWWEIKQGKYSVVVGARTAVLLPLSDIGAFVVEDESSSAYKEERRPRFHAREVVRERAQKCSALLVFGGSMPGLNIFQDITEGVVKQLVIPLDKPIAAVSVRIVDMKKEGRKGHLSPVLKDALADRLRLKQKSILFLNRKGTYKSVRCPKCHWVSPFDQKGNLPVKCPECGHAKLKFSGFGTHTLLTEVQKDFPWAKVVRWDAGLAQKENIPSDFDILVGTELVTQGFHFPGISLVGLVDADISLRIPDFRASEKTFQTLVHLLEQMEEHVVGAEMIIQTRHPDHDAFFRLQKKEVFEFFSSELKFRNELNYPPFSHLITVRSEEKLESKAENGMQKFLGWLSSVDKDAVVGILGPTLQSVPRKKTKVLQCLLKVPKSFFSEFMSHLNAYLAEKSRHLWFDVDPES